MPDVRALRSADLETVGAKASQLGELAQIQPPVPIPRAFALPFYAYHDHMARNHLDAELAALQARADFQNDPAVRERALHEFEAHVEAAPVRPGLIAGLRAQIQRTFPGVRVRLRSSTNAEDLVGFNGAGLYRSVVLPANATDQQLADALRHVWSSVWTFAGYEERGYFRIDQSRVAMAVLVQESIDDDVVDGVAITANPFNEGRPGLFINAQIAGGEGGAVTGARGDEVPEQVVYYTYGEEREFERLSRSSRANGGYVLSDDEVVNLAHVLRAIQDHFHPGEQAPSPLATDVEFILAGPARRLVVVQARPFTVRWDEGRGWATDPG
jgi:phosphoenolpyruvate synthase/pyruvate phosphate dikinase